jgi:hypothetical protein
VRHIASEMITIVIGSGYFTGHLAARADLHLAGPVQIFGFARGHRPETATRMNYQGN